MRILVDLPQGDIEALDQLSTADRKSRAAIIRAAIGDYLKERDQVRRRAAIMAGVGLWKGIDGLEYQERIRSEWDRDSAE